MQAYKFLRKEGKLIVSDRNNHKWKIGKWYSVEGTVIICRNGYHASKRPLDACRYVSGDVLAIVEYRGDIVEDKHKLVSREMRIVKAYHWTKEDDVAAQAYCASLVLHIFEKAYPDDPRVRECINVKRRYARGKATLAELDAARIAARTAARFAAGLAARAARAAEVSASVGANTTVWDAAAVTATAASSAAADAAARDVAIPAMRGAAWDMVKDDIEKKINAWMLKRVKKLRKVRT